MTDIGLRGPLPEHPQPSFFETTVVVKENPDLPAGIEEVVTHRDIEAIAAQPPWDIRDMQMKVTANLVLRGWTKNEHGVFVEPPLQITAPEPRQMKATKVTGVNRTKKTAKKTQPKRRS